MPCRHQQLQILSLPLGLLLVLGCAKWDLNERLPWANGAQAQLPDRILPMWSDTILYQRGKPGVRGFGGRLYFYDEGAQEPIKVDGSLVVYAFDADQHDPSDPAPKKQYVFTADQLSSHYSKSKLGHSYSVWLPWEEVGGPTKQISLIVRFEGRNGGVVITEPSTKLLPGLAVEQNRQPDAKKDNDLAAGRDPSESDVRPASFQTPDQTGRPKTSLQSSTINLPPSFARHLQPQPTPPAPRPGDRIVTAGGTV